MRVLHNINRFFYTKPNLSVVILPLLSALPLGLQADATVPCNQGSGTTTSIECGNDADTGTATLSTAVGRSAEATNSNSTSVGAFAVSTGFVSTAVGANAQATASNSTALGESAEATASNSTALGESAEATASSSTAVGKNADATAANSTAVGGWADARSEGAVSLGYHSGSSSVTDSPQAIAIGEHSEIAATSAGAIAIGGDVDGDSTGAKATGANAIVIGADAVTSTSNSIAVGGSSTASGSNSIAVGGSSSAAGTGSTAVGQGASAAESSSTAVGQNASVGSFFTTAIGVATNIDAFSGDSIALGSFAGVNNAAGGIAIGGDANLDSIGAQATQPGAIAIGADVVADIANTMVVGVPIHIKRSDGSSKLLVNETNTTVAVRTLGELENNGGVRLRFNNTALGEEWDFTSNQTGGFQFSLVGSGGAELSVATNGTVRMGPGPISNLTLFPSGNMTIEGVLTENSDRNSKQQITELDHESILDKVSALSIHEWEYKDSPDQRHIGPMAQDFHQAFNLGDDNKHIATLDMAGVALASIQALKTENETLNHEILKLKEIVQSMSNRIDMFE